jgi:hypothetical protein
MLSITVGNGIKMLYDCQIFPPEITEVLADGLKVPIMISFSQQQHSRSVS